jgi:chromosome segregation ATPase
VEGSPEVAVVGQQGTPNNAVVVNERDSTWAKARELTHAAEQASKNSAAKAYEAEAHLMAANDAHNAAQSHTNRMAELAAQAEAEKQNIGGLDYFHKELEKHKNKMEEHEKVHKDINKNLEVARNQVAAEADKLNQVAPLVGRHKDEADALANKLGSLRGAKNELEQKRGAHATTLAELQSKRAAHDADLARLTDEVQQLNVRAAELEQAARQARAAHDDRNKALLALRNAVAPIDADIEKAARNVRKVEKDLEAYDAKDAELAKKHAAADAAAREAADLLAARENALALARRNLEHEESKGLPVAVDIEKFRKEVEQKEREYIEAKKASEAAKAAHLKFANAAQEAAQQAAVAQQLKEERLQTYQALKAEAEAENAKESLLWEEAKKLGNTGDANALQRLAEAEKSLMETQSTVQQPVVVPQVAPKAPTTQGPTFHQEETNKRDVETHNQEHVTTHL